MTEAYEEGKVLNLEPALLQAISDAHAALLRVHNELEALKRLSEVAVAAAAYSVNKSDVVSRSQQIVQRAELLQKVVLEPDEYNETAEASEINSS